MAKSVPFFFSIFVPILFLSSTTHSYSTLLKQQHYKMKNQESIFDPLNSKVSGKVFTLLVGIFGGYRPDWNLRFHFV